LRLWNKLIKRERVNSSPWCDPLPCFFLLKLNVKMTLYYLVNLKQLTFSFQFYLYSNEKEIITLSLSLSLPLSLCLSVCLSLSLSLP
jgi:hypothetical protein